jgi:dTDP-4-dehydrorhamnose 3,5-epimerase
LPPIPISTLQKPKFPESLRAVKIQPLEIPGVLLIEPRVFADDRGLFLETFSAARYREAGIAEAFVQDNRSRSKKGVLRGLHFQVERPQGKLVSVLRGRIFDVVVDLRRSSSTYGRWLSVTLGGSAESGDDFRQLYVPPGLAHGFCALDDNVDVQYKCTDYYYPQHERTILWNDAKLAINWPIDAPLVSAKDRQGLTFDEAPHFD